MSARHRAEPGMLLPPSDPRVKAAIGACRPIFDDGRRRGNDTEMDWRDAAEVVNAVLEADDAMVYAPGLTYPSTELLGRIAKVEFENGDGREYVAEVVNRFGGPAWAGSWHGFTMDKGMPVVVKRWLT